MKQTQVFLTKNPCYQAGRTIQVKGLMLHSVGCGQPSAMAFVRSWDDPSYDRACVHAFIDGGDGTVFQTLPWDCRGWHCGRGPKGSGNDTHIGVEMCEAGCLRYTEGCRFLCGDLPAARAVADRTYGAAVELFAQLCRQYRLDPLADGVVISHSEGHARGIASGHADPEHLWSQLGLEYTMDGFRRDVKAAMEDKKEGEPMRYQAISDLPDYARATVKKLVDRGLLAGGGKARDGEGRPADLDLSAEMVRIFVVHDRAGLYDQRG